MGLFLCLPILISAVLLLVLSFLLRLGFGGLQLGPADQVISLWEARVLETPQGKCWRVADPWGQDGRGPSNRQRSGVGVTLKCPGEITQAGTRLTHIASYIFVWTVWHFCFSVCNIKFEGLKIKSKY